MPTKKKKLSLFIFIDAFGWKVMQQHPEFLKGLAHDQKKLETILGYSSACDPSIISGLTPSEHGLWSSFFYDPENCPYEWARHLRHIPDFIAQRGRVRNYLSRWIKNICGFTGYFHLYGIPFEHLPLFDYAEQIRIWEPEGLPHGKTIFDLLTEKNIPYYVHDSDASDSARFDRLMYDIGNRRIDFAYCSLGSLDALMHAHGTGRQRVKNLLFWYSDKIREVLAIAKANYLDVSWYVFTDHGMHDVIETYNLIADIETLGLEWNQDYVAFYDSTMARFWFLKDSARAPITQSLQDHPKGRIVSDDELKKFGVYFPDHQYGELIFLMNSGIQIVPSFMGTKPVKGMHGYDPSDPDSYASICSNRSIPDEITKIQHIYQLMLTDVGI